jgi:Phosphotyrosyl phosphatase activator
LKKNKTIGCIKFIKDVKKGVPFHESSPILNDISAAVSWQKVATVSKILWSLYLLGNGQNVSG